MKTLLLMRHAKSSWAEDGVADHDRPLNARGEKNAGEMAALLGAEGLQPGLILSSTAERARATALAVAEGFGWKPELRLLHALYLAEPDRILSEIACVAPDVGCLLVVGHNPGMEELVSDLSLMRQAMPTAAIARFAFGVDAWSEAASERGELVHVWRPRELD
ncbi:MAG: histidine phosphatase family protein [Myxococcales bacterium]|nr:histidine phosphatase family protein [Myxococcales bacterium]